MTKLKSSGSSIVILSLFVMHVGYGAQFLNDTCVV